MGSKRVISKNLSRNSVLPWIVVPIFATFFLISIVTLWRSSRTAFDQVAHDDIMHLQEIFKQIQKDCYIVDFEHVVNHIDFLNIQSFTDKKVGSMELAFPKRWKGPYLKKNLRVQNKLYAVLKNKQGYFIIPGKGVRLANGKVIGKTLILDQNSDMKQLMRDQDGLDSENGVLAARIKIGSRAMKNMTNKKLDMLSAIDA